jgi:hypothetical protein
LYDLVIVETLGFQLEEIRATPHLFELTLKKFNDRQKNSEQNPPFSLMGSLNMMKSKQGRKSSFSCQECS